MENQVTILGARGSVPVSGEAFQHYGGATTCFLVQLDGESILVDAGSGILSLPAELLEAPKLNLLLTHAHMDHLLGLPMCPYLFRTDAELTLYAAAHEDRTAAQQVGALLSPPLWPVGVDMLPCKVEFQDLPGTMRLGTVLVETMEGFHPGGVSLLRLTGGGRRVVITTDFTITDEQLPELTAFAKDCDLLLCDGQYSDEEWPVRCDFGHSTWTSAARFALRAGARNLRIIHHDPTHGDSMLDAATVDLRSIHPHSGFAAEGEVILL